MIGEAITDLGNGFFFFVSGYFFFKFAKNNFPTTIYIQKIKRRTHTLLVPYLLWNLIFMCFWGVILSTSITRSYFPGMCQQWATFSWKEFLDCFWSLPSIKDGASGGPIDTPLWFVRDLIVFSILSPIIYCLVKRSGIWICILSGIIYIASGAGVPGLNSMIFFFITGAYCFIYDKNIIADIEKNKTLIYFLWAISAICSVDAFMLWGDITYLPLRRCFTIMTITLLIFIISQFVRKRNIIPSQYLPELSFFIYAIHMTPLRIIAKVILQQIPPQSTWLLTACYFAIPITLIMILIGIFHLSRKYLPNFTRILLGNR